MYCTQCGNQAQEGAKYCPHCGARLIIVPAATNAAVQPAPGQPFVAQPLAGQPFVGQDPAAQPPVAEPSVGQPFVAQPSTSQPVNNQGLGQNQGLGRGLDQGRGPGVVPQPAVTAQPLAAEQLPPVQATSAVPGAPHQIRPLTAVPADTTAEFLSAAVASGIVVPPIDGTDQERVKGRDVYDEDRVTRPMIVLRALGILLIIAGVLALVAFSVLVAIPRLTGVQLVQIDGLPSFLQAPEATVQLDGDPQPGADGATAQGQAGEGGVPAQPATPSSIQEAPVDVDVSFETEVLDDERFSYPVFSASVKGTGVDKMNAAFKKDVEAAAGNAVPADDPKATGVYNSAYTTRTIAVTRIADGFASVVDRAYQTGNSGGGKIYGIVDGANYNLVTGDQASAAEMLGIDSAELQKLAEKAIGLYIDAHPDVAWWDDLDEQANQDGSWQGQTWQDNLAENFEKGFVHYFCTDEGVVAAVNELVLAPASAGMVIVFVAPFDDADQGAYKPGDGVDIDDVIHESGTLQISAAEVADALGVELPADTMASATDTAADGEPADGGESVDGGSGAASAGDETEPGRSADTGRDESQTAADAS